MNERLRLISHSRGPVTVVAARHATPYEREEALPASRACAIVADLASSETSLEPVALFELATGLDVRAGRAPSRRERCRRIEAVLERGGLLIVPGWAPFPAAPPVSTGTSRPPGPPPVALETKDQLLSYYFGAVERSFAREIQEALAKILPARRNLAIRGYVKFAARIAGRWAWTRAEEEEFKKQDTYRVMLAQATDIKEKFKQLNPGFYLGTKDDQVRSLDTQIEFWNKNKSVEGLGRDLDQKALTELAKPVYSTPSRASVGRFESWLARADLTWTTVANGRNVTYRSPTHATPGLSSHGRLRALDFLVYRAHDRQLVAGAVTGTARKDWDAAGWTAKLRSAIEAVSSDWEGPLPEPYEPWHYTYIAG